MYSEERLQNSKLIKEYFPSIVDYYSTLESATSITPSMIDLQPEIKWFMRPYLLDFLIELHSSFRLSSSTLFLALNIIDRYCSKRIVFKRHYQLVGTTSLWLASKYEDKKSRIPTLRELTTMCRNAYDDEMFIQMEMHILQTLDWNLSHPSLEDCLQLAIASSNLDGVKISTNEFGPHSGAFSNGFSDFIAPSAAFSNSNRSRGLSDSSTNSVNLNQSGISTFHSNSSFPGLNSNSLLPQTNFSGSTLSLPNSEPFDDSFEEDMFSTFSPNLAGSTNSTVSAITAIGRFFCELSLYDKVFLNFPTSLVAITANLLACNMLQLDNASDSLHYFLKQEQIHSSTRKTSINPEQENVHPQVFGPFLSGLDSVAILSIKKIALIFIVQLTKVTEVLTKKYDKLGVIQVITNFHNRFNMQISSISENHNHQLILLDSINGHLIDLAESLINFPQKPELLFFQKSPLSLNKFNQPQTPPSATSQYSVFSNKRSVNSTPTYSNSSIYNSAKSKISKNKNGHSSSSNFSEYSPCNANSNILHMNKIKLGTNNANTNINENWSSPIYN